MNLFLDKNLAIGYKSKSQISKKMSEGWVGSEVFCPNCGNSIEKYPENKPVADFYCKKCVDDFELKAKRGKTGKKITAGAYSKMIERLDSDKKPHFFFMGYLSTLLVNDFFIVPKYFFIPEIIEKRKALSETAKRAGWIGSNILFSKIPLSGKIFYVADGKEISKKEVLKNWQKTAFLKKEKKPERKGWILDIMNCINYLNKKEFSLQDIYDFEAELSMVYPNNRNIKSKIRQQLQFLRNKGYLEFIERGRYRLS